MVERWRRAGRPETAPQAAPVSVWLDAHAAAKHAGVTLAVLSQAVREGALPVSTQANGAWQIDVEDLDAWVATAHPR